MGELFTILQEQYFALIFLLIVIFVPMAFYGHYKIVGKRHYSHDSFLVVFTKYNIIVHWCAAVPFVMLCLTGLMMVFGDCYFIFCCVWDIDVFDVGERLSV